MLIYNANFLNKSHKTKNTLINDFLLPLDRVTAEALEPVYKTRTG